MAEMEWHGVQDDPKANWVLRIGVAIALVGAIAVGIYLWTHVRRQDRIEQFRQAVINGDAQEVEDLLAPSLAKRVDRPVLRAWLEWLETHREQLETGRWKLQAHPAPEGIRSFSLANADEHWVAQPSDVHLYRDQARRLISEIRQGMGDEVWRAFDNELQHQPLRHRLRDLAGKLGASTLLHPDQPMPRRTFVRQGRFVLQFSRGLTNSAGESKNLVVEFVFEPWRGQLADIRLEDHTGN